MRGIGKNRRGVISGRVEVVKNLLEAVGAQYAVHGITEHSIVVNCAAKEPKQMQGVIEDIWDRWDDVVAVTFRFEGASPYLHVIFECPNHGHGVQHEVEG